MFDIGFTQLLLIGVVALVVLGPERLPRVARTVGHLLGRAQRYVGDVKSDIQREMELDQIKDLKGQMEEAAQSVKSSVKQATDTLNDPLEEARKALKETSDSVESIVKSTQDDLDAISTSAQQELDELSSTAQEGLSDLSTSVQDIDTSAAKPAEPRPAELSEPYPAELAEPGPVKLPEPDAASDAELADRRLAQTPSPTPDTHNTPSDNDQKPGTPL